MQQIRTNCPLDCYAHCGLIAHTKNNRVLNITGDLQHPLNKGLICNKGRKKHLQRLYSPDRITTPLRKTKNGWKPVSWDNAYELIAENLHKILELYGPLAILHHDNGGSEGILKTLSQRFFNALGGYTSPSGSICWGSGYQAQQYDFGHLQLHEWEDVLNSRLIVLWGRDPATTNLQMMPLLREAKKKGAQIVVINPIAIASCSLADLHIAPRPGSDGALALAVAHEIIHNNWVNRAFVNEHVYGYEKYCELIKDYTPEKVTSITGVPTEQIRVLARTYGTTKPASIFFGYGLQRYTNSGQTVRAIDALAAITGNIGVAGGGANYAGSHWKGVLAPIKGSELSPVIREIPWPTLANELLEVSDPPVKAIFVTRSNPLTQLPETGKVRQAFNKAEFTVVADMLMNDTAEMADLFLPCTTFLEEEEVLHSSWNHYLAYSPKVVEPLGDSRSDHHIFSGLAQFMGISGFPNLTSEQWLQRALAPLAKYGITLDKLKAGPLRHPLAPDVPWQDYSFSTPSGKFELYSQLAERAALNPLPEYTEPTESPLRNPLLAQQFPYHLITAHHPDYLHSQFWHLEGGQDLQAVYLHPKTACKIGVEANQNVVVATLRGKASFRVSLSDKLREDTILIYQGHWAKHGNGVNCLTPQYIPDMGLGTPYYDCLCQVEPNK